MMSHPAMSLGLRFCVNRKGGTGGGRWDANSMAMTGLLDRKALFDTGRAISVVFGINGEPSCPVGPPFQHSWRIFQLQQVGISRET